MALLLRIPWSHYCQKAEWGLTLQRMPYGTVDVGIARMARWSPRLPEGTVPVLRQDDGGLVPGSARILAWADRHGARPGMLYPDAEVRDWEAWADEAIGPLARREAYRCIHATPTRYGRRRVLHALYLAGRPVALKVLKAYKARRFEEEDARRVPRILERVVARLDEAGTGYLFGARPTAADLATAALWAPMLPIRDHPARGPAWDDVAAFVRRVRPMRVTRTHRRWARERDLQDWAAPAAA